MQQRVEALGDLADLLLEAADLAGDGVDLALERRLLVVGRLDALLQRRDPVVDRLLLVDDVGECRRSRREHDDQAEDRIGGPFGGFRGGSPTLPCPQRRLAVRVGRLGSGTITGPGGSCGTGSGSGTITGPGGSEGSGCGSGTTTRRLSLPRGDPFVSPLSPLCPHRALVTHPPRLSQLADERPVVVVRDLARAVVELELFEGGERAVALLGEGEPLLLRLGRAVFRRRVAQQRPRDERDGGDGEQRRRGRAPRSAPRPPGADGRSAPRGGAPRARPARA